MQIDEAEMKNGRPVPPKGCPGRMGVRCPQKVHRRGSYSTKSTEMPTMCFRCVLCGKTFSVRPKNRLPHQQQSLGEIADHIENSVGEEPPKEEKPEERRRRIRVFNAFASQRMLLAGLFALALDSTEACIWKFLQARFGNAQSIAEALHRSARVSLTGCYRSLRASWEREFEVTRAP